MTTETGDRSTNNIYHDGFLGDTIQDLKRKLQASYKREEELEADNAIKENTIIALRHDNEVVETKARENWDRGDRLHDEYGEKIDEIQSLRNRLRVTEDDRQKMYHQNIRLHEDNRNAYARIHNAQVVGGKLTFLENWNRELMGEVHAARREALCLQEQARTGSHQAEIQRLRNDLHHLNDDVNKLRTERDNALAEKQRLQTVMTQRQAVFNRIRMKIDDFRQDIRRLQRAVAQRDAQIARYQRIIDAPGSAPNENEKIEYESPFVEDINNGLER